MPKKAQRPAPHPIAELIYQAWQNGEVGRHGQEEPHRWHLGASQLGKECDRMLWYSFHWVQRSNFPGRLLRLFDRGDLEEPRIVTDLKAIGCDVRELEEGTERQIRHAWHSGHLAQSIDGLASNVPGYDPAEVMVCEFKTAKESIWSSLAANGVAIEQPHYWAQCQLGMEGQGLERCLFVSVNKDTDEIYVEVVPFDRSAAEKLLAKGRRIVDSPMPLAKISDDPTFWKCRFCDVSEVCHFGKMPEVNCRTCAHSTPVQGGETGDWTCALAHPDQRIPEDVMRTGCPSHVFNPELVWAEVEDADEEGKWVAYALREGTIRNGADALPSAEFAKRLDAANPKLL